MVGEVETDEILTALFEGTSDTIRSLHFFFIMLIQLYEHLHFTQRTST